MMASAASAALTTADLQRAMTPKPLPGSHVLGSNGKEIFSNMNKHLESQPYDTKACESWSHEELNNLAALLWQHRDQDLAAMYEVKGDKRAFHFEEGLNYKNKLWEQEQERVSKSPKEHGPGTDSYDTVRDGKCAEMVMWWIHHLPASAREALVGMKGFQVPLLPANGYKETDNKEYVYQISCSDCHSQGKGYADSVKAVSHLRSKSGDVPPGTCPIDAKTGLPSVWYEPMSDVGNRKKRCDWDYDPPCGLCEGVGGYSWGDQEHDISYTSCKPIALPKDIPVGNVTNPVWPKTFTVQEVTVLINQISEGGQFPGANPCDVHNFNNDTETFYYDGYAPQIFTKTSKADIYTLKSADMFIKIAGTFCICVTPVQNGNKTAIPTGPLYFDFAKDAVLIGREEIGLEGLGKTSVADHWNKGPHHFWIDVASNKMVRGWQPWNGLNVYYDWDLTAPDPKVFEVPKSCYSGALHKNISCIAPYP